MSGCGPAGAAEEYKDDPFFHQLLAEIATVAPNLFPYRGYTIIHRKDTQEPLHETLVRATRGRGNRRGLQWVVVAEGGIAERATPHLVHLFGHGESVGWDGPGHDGHRRLPQLHHQRPLPIPLLLLQPSLPFLLQSTETLLPYGVDPYAILMKAAEDSYKDTRTAMVCITAVQLALTDLLRSLGVEPDGIIGHSTGEISAGYGDGCLNRAEAILLAYHRGQSVITTEFPPGAMAAVGLNWEDAKARCPPGVIAACHNGADSVTVSGTPEAVKKMQEELEGTASLLPPYSLHL